MFNFETILYNFYNNILLWRKDSVYGIYIFILKPYIVKPWEPLCCIYVNSGYITNICSPGSPYIWWRYFHLEAISTRFKVGYFNFYTIYFNRCWVNMCVARWLAVVGGCRQCRGRAGLSTSVLLATRRQQHTAHQSSPPQCLSGNSSDPRMSSWSRWLHSFYKLYTLKSSK